MVDSVSVGRSRSATVSRGHHTWQLRRAAAARVAHARVEAKILEALAASSGLQLQRGRCLRLRLDEKNTLMAFHARNYQQLGRYCRFTKTAETKLKNACDSGGYLG